MNQLDRVRAPFKELLVEHIPNQQWRLRRVYCAELAGVVEPKRDDDWRVIRAMARRENKLEHSLPVFIPSDRISDKLMRYQRVLESSTSRHLAELRRLQSQPHVRGRNRV